MTNPTVRDFVFAQSSSDGTTLPSVTVPATVQDGDYGLYVVTINSAATLTTPSGFTENHTDNTNSNDYLHLCDGPLNASDAGRVLTGTLSAAGGGVVSLIVIAGSNKAIDAFATPNIESANDTAVTIPGLTPVANDCLRLYIDSYSPSAINTAASVSTPTGYTEIIDATATGSAAGTRRLGHAIGYQALTGQAGVAQGSASATANIAMHEICYSLTIAPTPNISVAAGVASATGTAEFDTTAVSVDLELVADNPILAVGVAGDASVALLVNADVAAGSGAAYDATVPTAPQLLAFAEVAAAVGAALDAVVVIFVPEIPVLYRFTSPVQSYIERPLQVPGDPNPGPAVQRVIGLTVMRVAGVWKTRPPADVSEELAADRLYYGGHVYTIDAAAAAELDAAGYGANLVRIQ